MTTIKIDCGNGIIKNVDIDMSSVLKDVCDNGNEISTRMVIKRIRSGKFDRAFKMAYPGLTCGANGLPTMSLFKFALKYGKQV